MTDNFIPARVLVLIKGAGDLASGVALRLHRCGFPVVMTELPEPMMVRRTVSFGEAVYTGEHTVEGVAAHLASDPEVARALLAAGSIPVLVDQEAACLASLRPTVLVDAIMAKRNTGTRSGDAPLVVALGPGFTAGVDCDAVIETNRGHNLGRVIWRGSAEPDTGTPGEVAGRGRERVLRAPAAGMLETHAAIGDLLEPDQLIATVAGKEVRAPFAGVLRGLVRQGMVVASGLKIGDLDPRARRQHCFTVSDKSLAIGGGVLEAILTWTRRLGP